MTEEIEKRKTVNILMVEDNPSDAFLTKEILAESEKASYEVYTLKDGIEALSHLRKMNGYGSASKPDLIMIDLNLPKMHGFDFLSRIKTDPELKTIPVCILTTSDSETDVEKSKELGVECYLIKPLDLGEFESAFSRIVDDKSSI
jgi:two-component system, chemotaxis family, response regulator Rcp1